MQYNDEHGITPETIIKAIQKKMVPGTGGRWKETGGGSGWDEEGSEVKGWGGGNKEGVWGLDGCMFG